MRINKHNSLTDGSIPKTTKQVLPDRLLNALYYKYEREGPTFSLSISELKRLLGLERERDSERIYKAISILQRPIQIRDFRYGEEEIAWISAPFLARAIRYKGAINHIEFTIDPMVLEALRQKAGYTPLDLRICNRFKTKYGLKLYEMYRRYYSLPHKEECVNNKIVGVVKKSLQELNFLFGSDFLYPSQLLRVIKRGLEEIESVVQITIHCFYAKEEKFFVFSWEREIDGHYPTKKCPIPTKRIDAFLEWYKKNVIDENIEHEEAYTENLRQRILEGTFYNLKEFYGYYLQEIGLDWQECFDAKKGKFTC
jgi:hypothetical protein